MWFGLAISGFQKWNKRCNFSGQTVVTEGRYMKELSPFGLYSFN
jgi:hypothetical protein